MRIRFNIALVAALFCAGLANAQSNKPEMLVGSWKVESLQPKFPVNITAKEKAKDEKTIADDEAEFKKAGFRFTGTELLVGPKKFTWKMSSSGNKVTVKKNKKTIINATILTLTADRLVFTRPDEGMIVTYTLSK